MKIAIRILAGFFSVLLIIIASAAILLTTMVNSSWLKKQISQYAQSATGRELNIKGSLHTSFWPRLGIRVDDVSLSNPAGFGEEPFLVAHKLTITAELMPLLHRQLIVNRATLTNTVINLQKNAQGKTNWAFSPEQELSTHALPTEQRDRTVEKTQPDAPLNQPSSAQTVPAPAAMQFNIAALSMTHTTILYSDAQTGQQFSLEGANLTVGGLSSDRPFTLRGDATYVSKEKTQTQIKLNTEATYNKSTSELSLKNMGLRLKPENFAEVRIKTDLNANLDTAAISLPTLSLESGDLILKGNLSGGHLRDKPALKGHLSSNVFNLSRLLTSTGKPLTLKNKNALSRVQFTTDLQVSAEKISLSAFDAQIDGHDFTGQAEYLLSSTPHLSFKLRSDALKLEDYLPVGSSTSDTSKSQSDKSASKPMIIEGYLELQRFVYDAYTLSNLKTTLKYSDNKLNLNNFSANTFGGSTIGQISFNNSGNIPSFSLSQKMSGIRAENLLNTLTGSAKLSGATNLTINVSATGKSADAIKHSLSGKVFFTLSNGKISGTDIDYKIDQAIAKYAQRTAKLTDQGQTSFSRLSGSTSFSNGNSSTPDLEFLTPTIRVRARGNHNLLSNSLDYALVCRLLQPQDIKADYLGVKINADLANYDIPAKVGCTLESPCVKVDMGGLMKLLASEGAKAATKAVIKKELLKHVDENLGKALDKFLSQ